MSTNGTLQNLHEVSGLGYIIVKPISQDTLIYTGSAVGWGGAVSFLNLTTDEITSFPNVLTDHDVDYNPVNNTFLTLEKYSRDINGTEITFDKIVEVNATGGVLWTWDSYNYIPLSEASLLDPAADFTHGNTIQWDYNDNIVYFNTRNLNTFYKINMTSGSIIWACGSARLVFLTGLIHT